MSKEDVLLNHCCHNNMCGIIETLNQSTTGYSSNKTANGLNSGSLCVPHNSLLPSTSTNVDSCCVPMEQDDIADQTVPSQPQQHPYNNVHNAIDTFLPDTTTPDKAGQSSYSNAVSSTVTSYDQPCINVNNSCSSGFTQCIQTDPVGIQSSPSFTSNKKSLLDITTLSSIDEEDETVHAGHYASSAPRKGSVVFSSATAGRRRSVQNNLDSLRVHNLGGSSSNVSLSSRRPSAMSRRSSVFRYLSRASSVTLSLRKLQVQIAQGRDFESVYTNHKYTKSERDVLATYNTFDYLPSHSVVYKEWLQRQPARLDWDRWLMMGMIGITVGLVGFLLHQLVHAISHFKWEMALELLHEGKLVTYAAWVLGYSLAFVAMSAGLVVFVCLASAGSGIPEVMGFLNGTVMRHVLNLRAFIVKFFSCAFAVGGGMPIGPEGPMIHMGSIIGTGLSQFRSRTLGLSLPFFQRFRNSEDRRNFTAAGAAAGVASAFTAPVGGLLFGMEEVSSFWSIKLGWMIFFCSMLASVTTDILNSAFNGFHYTGSFGIIKTDKYILFKERYSAVHVNILMFIPAIVCGILGGILGAMYAICSLKINRLRRRIITKMRKECYRQIFRFTEPLLIMLIWGTITMQLPRFFECRPIVCPQHMNETSLVANLSLDAHGPGAEHSDHTMSSAAIERWCSKGMHGWMVDEEVQPHMCAPMVKDGDIIISGEFNEVASLINVHAQDALRLLFSRKTHYQFSYSSLLIVFTFYFFMSCWASCSCISCGIVVPMLMIGGLYGRLVGRVLVDIYGSASDNIFWEWIDPGAMALVGAASFFGGVTRLTLSLTVIMVEITNDVSFVLPIMIGIMVAKWVGDYITHPLYHSLLELKCIPYLGTEPIVYDEEKKLLNLELYKARNVMHSPVITITPKESVTHLARILSETTHGGFPVVKWADESQLEVAYGLLTRTELCVIICDPSIQQQSKGGVTITPHIPYEEVSIERMPNCINMEEILSKYISNSYYRHVYIDLEAYINRSAPRIDENFSLHRTYIIFRSLGLRHLTVVDLANRVVGIITRKDLMGFNLEEHLVNRKLRGFSFDGGITKLLASEMETSLGSKDVV